jgi:dipeptidyl aminopeptidase/acylaminoacyl peptidase
VAVSLAIILWYLNRSFVRIVFSPANAIVRLNNAPLDHTSSGQIRKTLKPGSYKISVEANGYISFSREFQLKPAQILNLDISLKELPKPVALSGGGGFVERDSSFNSFLYLGNNSKAIYRIKTSLNDKNEVELKNQLPLTDPKLFGIQEIVWSPDHQLALFRKTDGIYLFDFNKYDFLTQTESLWGKDIGSIAWSPDNSTIAYYYAPPGGEKTLIFADAAHKQVTRVADMAEAGIENPILHWSPDSEWLLVIPRDAKDYDENRIYLFNAYSRTFKEATDTGNQLDAIFSPDGNRILYSTYSKDSSNLTHSVLSVMNKDGSEKRSLDIRANLSKIAWVKDSTTIFIAAPLFNGDKDSIFAYNLDTKKMLDFSIDPDVKNGIIKLLLSDDERMLIYETKEGLYVIKIT